MFWGFLEGFFILIFILAAWKRKSSYVQSRHSKQLRNITFHSVTQPVAFHHIIDVLNLSCILGIALTLKGNGCRKIIVQLTHLKRNTNKNNTTFIKNT